MKKTITLFAILFIAVATLSAQKKIKVSESTEKINDGKHNSLVVMLYEISEKDVQKAWKKKLKDFGRPKTKRNTFYIEEAEHKKMGDKVFYLHSYTEETKDGVKVVTAIDLGGAYMNSNEHKDQYKFMEKFIYEFAVEATKEAIDEVIKEESKTLSKMEKEMKDLEKDKKDLESDIKDYEKKIEKAKKDIEKNEKDQKDQKKKLEEQKKVVSEIEKKKKSVK